MNSQETNQAYQFLTAKAVGRLLSLSQRTVWRYRAIGALPKPLKISGAIRWRESDIALWQERGCPDQKTFETMRAAK